MSPHRFGPDILVKFREGGALHETPRGLVAEHLDLRGFNTVLDSVVNSVQVRRSFRSPARHLKDFRRAASYRLSRVGRGTLGGRSLPSMDLFVRVRPRVVLRDIDALVRRFASDAAIDYAVVAALPGDPPSPLIPTPDLTPNQGYLGPAPVGVDAKYAWTKAGGDGSWVWVCDCEFGYGEHEDLPYILALSNRDGDLEQFPDHGTQVLGVVGGKADGKGVTGIAPAAKLVFASESGGHRTDCIDDARLNLWPGDVLLLEMQTKDELPAEKNHDVHTAIKHLTGYGVVTVAAVGNGSKNLDKEADDKGELIWSTGPDEDDSGAILVGAGRPNVASGSNYRIAASNYGTRVNCQGWGAEVSTCGGISNLHSGGDSTTAYTKMFSGTSSAAAMIAGCVACLQGAAWEYLGAPLMPEEVRDLLSDPANGTPQLTKRGNSAGSYNIGPLPDLKKVFTKAFKTAGIP